MNQKKCKYALAIALEAGPREPVLLRGDLLACSAKAQVLGYDAVEVHLRDVGKVDIPALKEFCTKNELGVSAFATGLAKRVDGLSFLDDLAEIRHQAVERVKKFIDAAELFNAGVIIGSLRGNIPDEKKRAVYDERFFDCMQQLIPYAGAKNVHLLLEVINRYENNYLNTVEEALRYIEPLEQDVVKLHLDTFHMNIEETNMAGAIEKCGRRLGYLHVADNTRLAVGTGSINFKAVLEATQKVGYTGYISLECLPFPTGEEAAEASLKALKAISV